MLSPRLRCCLASDQVADRVAKTDLVLPNGLAVIVPLTLLWLRQTQL